MSVTVKRDLEEHRQSLGRGDDGGIPESIIPSGTSYCEVAASSLKEEEVKAEQSESANAEPMEVDTSGDANDGANPILRSQRLKGLSRVNRGSTRSWDTSPRSIVRTHPC